MPRGRYANRAKQMAPPSAPQRHVRETHPVDDKVEVLRELKESLLPMMKQISTPPQAQQEEASAKGGKKGKESKAADKENAKQVAAH